MKRGFGNEMVIFAYLGTNVTAVQQDIEIDYSYRVQFREAWRSEDVEKVILKDHGGRNHELNPRDGIVNLFNVQLHESPDVVEALLGKRADESFKKGLYAPVVSIYHVESFKQELPTIFQLERVATNPVEFTGLIRLNADGDYEILPSKDYFIEEKAKVDAFMDQYRVAAANSRHGRPILEGYCNAMKEKGYMRALEPVFGKRWMEILSER